MHRQNNSLPLAFLLALAADGTSVPGIDGGASAPILTHGMLSSLLDETPPATGQKLAQIQFPGFRNFGFLNCFNGSWRNC